MTSPSRAIVLGASGHARVICAAYGGEVIGCLTPHAPDGDWPAHIPWLGGDDRLDSLDRSDVSVLIGVGSAGDPTRRVQVYEMARSRGFSIAAVVHARAFVERDVKLGEGVQIMAGALVQTGSVLGDNVLINTGGIVDHDARVGDHVHIAPGVALSGGVRIGARSHVGTGARVIQGITIGRDVVVAAGAAVIRDVPDGVRVAGVPARLMGRSGRQG